MQATHSAKGIKNKKKYNMVMVLHKGLAADFGRHWCSD